MYRTICGWIDEIIVGLLYALALFLIVLTSTSLWMLWRPEIRHFLLSVQKFLLG